METAHTHTCAIDIAVTNWGLSIYSEYLRLNLSTWRSPWSHTPLCLDQQCRRLLYNFDLQAVFMMDIAANLHTMWRHDMETLSALLTLCEGNPSVIDGFPSQRASNASCDVFFDILKGTVEQTVQLVVICDAMTLMWCHCNVVLWYRHIKAETKLPPFCRQHFQIL